MQKKEVSIIEIKWHGPYSQTDFHTLNDENHYGLYQLYGTHEIYGSETLLYLGKARDRAFSTRFSEHEKDWFDWQSSVVSMYVGQLGGTEQPGNEEWSNQIDEAEKLLIHFCTPPYNSQHIQDYKYQEDILVLNYGKKKMLPYAVTSVMLNSPYWNQKLWSTYRYAK